MIAIFILLSNLFILCLDLSN